MKAKKGLIGLTIALGLLALGGVVLAQVSTNFDLGWHVLSGGGGSRSSTNYQIDDVLGQWADRTSASTNYQVEPGFWSGAGASGSSADGDTYEADDTCGAANSIPTDGTVQTHTFHDEGDADWIKFDGQASKTYIIRVDNVGDWVDAVVILYDACDEPPLGYNDNAFGPTITMEWDCEADGEYYLKLVQSDPSYFGEGTNYDLSIAVDSEPPSAPRSVRSSPDDETLIVQWRKSPERDVAGYRVRWGTNEGGPYSGVDEVDGADNTYYAITGLTNGTAYYIVVHAWDLSGNVSDPSVEIGDIPAPSGDTTLPSVVVKRPSAAAVYTTTASSLTVGGDCTDAGSNLSRVHVRNTTNGAEGWDYSLSADSAIFNVESIPLVLGTNQIEVTAYDTVSNTGTAALTIERISGLNGAVVIVGGHDNLYSLQTKIDYSTNRAYRLFRDAGFGAEDIRYLSPTPQDADEDSFTDVFTTTTPTEVEAAIQWAAGRVGPDVPFFLYMMDHGLEEAFCADGCSAGGQVSSKKLNEWLSNLETTSGCDEVNVIIEACHSGSFVDRVDDPLKSISKDGRVVIASTDRTNNAYASAQGALFSDAFFSAVGSSASLLSGFNYARSAVETAGNEQTPWLDDNGDGLSNAIDGAYATERYVTSYFGSLLPEVMLASVVLTGGGDGTIRANVARGDEELKMVWAAVYAPSFEEPTGTTMNLGVPLILLEPDPEQEGVYTANYNGFLEEGAYRVLIYAEDEIGNQALPYLAFVGGEVVYLPLTLRTE
jgi:hypothetical protein